jgi:hypothetical protein
MSKDIVARASLYEPIDSDNPTETKQLIEELIEEVESLRRAITRINQIVVANMPSSG